MTTSTVSRFLSIVLGATALIYAIPASAQTKPLRFVPQSDLRVLDPVWTTDYMARNHGYMVYDTLFALDSSFNVQPQMVDRWTVSPDGLTYRFTLRDGLLFHDGQPVRAADCIASIERWSKRDTFGQMDAEKIAAMEAVDDKTFVITLRSPYPLLLNSFAKLSGNVPFIMPERIAKTDPFKQITEVVGSGPFRFMKDEWVQGSKVVYTKNTTYVPRREPPSWAAGGKVVKIDRVEWLIIPDPTSATAALAAGEVDIMEQVPLDLLPVLRRNANLTVDNVPLGGMPYLRFNQTIPPFDNPKMRQAVLYLIDQAEYMTAIAGDKSNWSTCYSFFTCGTPLANEEGAEILKGPRDPEKAKQLIREAGYKGEKIVIISATDQPIMHAQSLVTVELFKKVGLNVELQAMDFSTLITRRVSREPADRGGWNIFHSRAMGPDMDTPATNTTVRGNGDKGFPGWVNDPVIEQIRTAWFAAPDAAAQKKLAIDLQRQAYITLPFIPTGYVVQPMAFRKDLDGVNVAPIPILWGIERRGAAAR